jgi:hypothetical protein
MAFAKHASSLMLLKGLHGGQVGGIPSARILHVHGPNDNADSAANTQCVALATMLTALPVAASHTGYIRNTAH